MVDIDVDVEMDVLVEVVVVDEDVLVVVVLVRSPARWSYPSDFPIPPISPKSAFWAYSTSLDLRKKGVVAACIPPLKSSISRVLSPMGVGASGISYLPIGFSYVIIAVIPVSV